METNNTPKPNEEKLSSAKSKTVSLVILVVVLGILAWSAIQIVKVFPNAISSLASLAESVYTFKPTDSKNSLSINSDKNILDTGENINISWEKMETNGIYTFSYECEDGVAVDLKSEDGEFKSISCNNSYDLNSRNQIELRVDSEKKRFADLNYSIAYFKKNETAASIRETNSISVFNSQIVGNGENNVVIDQEETNNNENTEVPTATPEAPVEEPSDVEPDEDKIVTTPTPTTPASTIVTAPVYIYEIPTSNPNGQVDLALSNIQVGIKNNLGHFINTDKVNKNTASAIQFTVHNIGNKTSERWTFEANVFGVTNYTSPNQSPLKPNERAVITIEFPAPQKTDNQLIEITTKTKVDKNLGNNYLTRQIVIN